VTASDRDVAIATVREFARRSAALRVVVLLDEGPERPAVLLGCEDGGPVVVTHSGHTLAGIPDPAEPVEIDVPRVPAGAIDLDPDRDEIAAPMGTIPALAGAVLGLARALGGRSVATAEFETRGGEPLAIAARDGEPVVLTVAGQQYELPPGWP
jgi:hypothetical protein